MSGATDPPPRGPDPTPLADRAGPGRRTVRPGPYWAGVVASAVVSALVGLVAALVARNILSIDLISPAWVPGASDVTRFTVLGALAAVVAGALLYLLFLATPTPVQFFLWIVGLLTVAAAVVPFSDHATTKEQLTTAVVVGLIGVSVMAVLPGVAVRTAAVPGARRT